MQTKPGAVPREKRYLDEQEGQPIDDVWSDFPPFNSQAAERLGYPTQKPLALLDRIINASSDPHGIVLDAFCGCGTAIVSAEKNHRSGSASTSRPLPAASLPSGCATCAE